MKDISVIINTFSKEDKQEFVRFLKKKNQRGDVKNLQLFKLIDTGKQQDLDILLYGKPSKNAYHALCKRLRDSLVDFTASKGFSGETSEEMEIMKLLLAGRIFLEQKLNKTAFKILAKAEKEALALDLHPILNEIYHTKIQFAHLNPNETLEEVIQASHTNMERFKKQFQLNMAYASIKKQLKNPGDTPITEIILKHFTVFNIKVDATLTYKSLFQLLNITSTAAALQRNYHEVSSFMMEIYNIISEKKGMAQKHLFYHIEILQLMAVGSFRNKDFKQSKEFVAKMEAEMQKNNRQYYRRFKDKLLVLKAMNLTYTGYVNKAVHLLENSKNISLDSQLTLCMCFFQQSEFSKAYQVFKNFTHSDHWYDKKIGWLWVLKKSIIEILLLVELDKLDLVLSRLQSFKKRFAKPLKKAGEERVLTFMKLVSDYYENPEQVTTDTFKNKVETSFDWVGTHQEDIFVMSFYAWLKAKINNTNPYKTTLELVS
ncbi:hypothetical protein [Marixanthomonas spongiae]|uniref:Uncharacterized protein n=1 Tax=Marixanthomonas spongiae TaxID=2174845 RepID=A0A2U0HZT6_9FLAO|nr:hypothetical protein [Marixanthomonas spongiae]PVW14336.1 hypothetical protein DDV96_11090 [Marixanthomonas spongiae]